MKTLIIILLLLTTVARALAQDGFNDLRNREKNRNKNLPVLSVSQTSSFIGEIDSLENIKVDFLEYLLKNDALERSRTLGVFKVYANTADSISRAYKNKYAAHYFKRTDESRDVIIHQDSIASRIVFLADTLMQRVGRMKVTLDTIQTVIAKIEALKERQSYRDIEAKIRKELKNVLTQKDIIEETIKHLSAKEKEYLKKATTEEQQRSFITAFPQINDVLGGSSGALIPTLNLLGNQFFNKGTFKGEIRLFSAAVSKNQKYDWRSLALSEQSDFGIVVDIDKGFWVNKKKNKFSDFGLSGSVAYLMKPGFLIEQKDSVNFKDFSYGVLQFKLGVQYIAFPNILTLHADYSGFSIVTNLRKVHDYMPALYENRNKPSMGYYSAGARFRITPSGFGSNKLTTSYLVLDLNFTFINDFLARMSDVSYTKATKTPVDKVIPTIRISLTL